MNYYTDRDGDEIAVADHLDSDDELLIECGSETMYLSQEDAIAFALSVYKAAGGQESDGPVRASEISFNEGVIRLAAIHGKTVEFRYVKSESAAPETRRFVPSGVQGAGDKLRFVGRDTDREDYRSFRLDRIRGTVGVIA